MTLIYPIKFYGKYSTSYDSTGDKQHGRMGSIQEQGNRAGAGRVYDPGDIPRGDRGNAGPVGGRAWTTPGTDHSNNRGPGKLK